MYKLAQSITAAAFLSAAHSLPVAAILLAPQAAQAAQIAITKAQAVQIAQTAVGVRTKFQAVTFDRFDQPPHWSVDLFDAVHDYEVWVSTAGKVLRIIVQPR